MFYIPGMQVNCFFSCFLYYYLGDKIDYDKILDKNDYIDSVTQRNIIERKNDFLQDS